jgi:cell pole-organizing protein PopZ
MEDILNSIRKAVEAEDWPEENPDDEEVIELTRVVTGDGRVVDLSAEEAREEREDAPAAEKMQQSEDEVASEDKHDEFEPQSGEEKPAEEAAASGPGDRFSAAAGTAALSSFLTRTELRPVDAGPHLGSGRTLESVVREALVPHVRDWLEENLAPLVQNIVREEIERMVRHNKDD